MTKSNGSLSNLFIPYFAASAISGHKTRCVFDRYNIVSDADLRLVAKKSKNPTLMTGGGTKGDKGGIVRDAPGYVSR